MDVSTDQEGSAFSDTEGSAEGDYSGTLMVTPYCQRYHSRFVRIIFYILLFTAHMQVSLSITVTMVKNVLITTFYSET